MVPSTHIYSHECIVYIMRTRVCEKHALTHKHTDPHTYTHIEAFGLLFVCRARSQSPFWFGLRRRCGSSHALCMAECITRTANRKCGGSFGEIERMRMRERGKFGGKSVQVNRRVHAITSLEFDPGRVRVDGAL